MRIGRVQSGITLNVDQEEYRYFLKEAPAGDGRLRVKGRFDPSHQHFYAEFGEGYVFNRGNSELSDPTWTAHVPNGVANAPTSLPLFGFTPTTWKQKTRWRYVIDVPDIKSPIRGHHSRPALVEVAQRTLNSFDPTVTSDDLALVRDVFNQAIRQGFVAQFNGQGQVLWFDPPNEEDR